MATAVGWGEVGRGQSDDMGSYWTTLPLMGYRQSNPVPPGAHFSSEGRVWTLEEEAMDLPRCPPWAQLGYGKSKGMVQ